jgi:hypothetical protein
MASTDAAGTALSIIDDTTFRSTLSYASLFEEARQAAMSLGGTQKQSDPAAGSLQFKYRYGINPTGIRVDMQFRRVADGGTEVIVTGRIGDSFDTMGAGRAKARTVFNELLRRLQAPGGSAFPESPPASAPGPALAASAPVVGDPTVAHRGKSKTTAALLALFLGGIGAHRFYLGAWGWGLVYLGVFLTGALGLLLGLTAVVGVAEAIRFFVVKQPNLAPVKPFTF